MKRYLNGMMVALTLVLALVLGAVALAENAAQEATEAPSAPETAAPEEAAPETEQLSDAEAQEDSAALKDALKAYKAARQSSRQEALEAELNSFVEAGKLTREQADLILEYYTEQKSLRDGTCPNCGYQFRMGKGASLNGSDKGGARHGRTGGSRGTSDQQPSGRQSAPDKKSKEDPATGTSFLPGAEVMPETSGSVDI